ncbi:MAG TPA: ATP-binding protein [Xenococcaceae cyanobacterium]
MVFSWLNDLGGQNLSWLDQLSDIAIALAFDCLSLLLIYVIYRREAIPFKGLGLLFTIFLVFGGITQIISVATFWQPDSWLKELTRELTAIIALVIAILMAWVISKIHYIPSWQQLQEINERINQELAQFQSLEFQVQNLNTQLEQKVARSTTELRQLNQKLITEIEARKQIESDLQRQIQLEQIVRSLFHSFIHVPASKLDSTIDEALDSISQFIGVDRSDLLLLTKQNNQLQITQQWSRVIGCENQAINQGSVSELLNLAESEQASACPKQQESTPQPAKSTIATSLTKCLLKLPWFVRLINHNQVINLPEIASLPPEAKAERLYLTKHQIKSLLIVPLFYHNALKGILVLEAVQQSKLWTASDIQLLKLTGEIIGAAIARCDQAAELINRTQQLETSNQELEKFASIVAHDLLEPLRSISGFNYLLQEESHSQLSLEAQEYLNLIDEGTVRMKQLIEDLLAFSRVGRQNLALTLVDSEQVIQEAIANLQAAIAETQAQIHWESLPQVIADKTQLTQLWQNLIANALKFRNPQLTPQIHIWATQTPQESIFAIHDNGIGIDPQFGDAIFAIFKRLHNLAHYPGTGIGLAICRRITELHEGKIWVKSSVGKGSTFYVSLPIRTQKELGNEDSNNTSTT